MAAPPSPSLIADLQSHWHDDRRAEILVFTGVFMAVAITAVVLRVVARRRVSVPFQADDWLAVIALVPVLGCCICTIFVVKSGTGLHIIRIHDHAPLDKSTLATQICYGLSFLPLKLSLLCLYRRIFPSKQLRRATVVVGVFVALYVTAQVICMLVRCIPISYIWTMKNGHCFDFGAALTTFSVTNILTDVALLALPMPFLYNLQTKRSTRWQLMAIFGIGFSVTSVSIVRAVLVARKPSFDRSWQYVPIVIISMIEVCLGCLSTCLPTYRPLFVKPPPPAWTTAGSNSQTQKHSQGKSHGHSQRVSHGALSQSDSWIRLREKEQAVSITEDISQDDASVGTDEPPRCLSPGIHIRTDVEVVDMQHPG